jgi:UDP-N-acetylglucosamine 2-epimerase (non-hydrolysing)
MEEASVMMVGLKPERILQALVQLTHQQVGNNDTNLPPPKANQKLRNIKLLTVNDYLVPNVSEKVVRIILGYTDYIKRIVWHV